MFIRHDTITLHSGVTDADFEQFMTDQLLPFFSEAYKGPTRSSHADIKGQSLLKATERPHQYLWVTAWDGTAESVAGASFENARMSKTAATQETGAMLKKLDAFGKRAPEHLFAELASMVVETNK